MSLIKAMMVTTSTSSIGESLCLIIAQSVTQKSTEKNLFLYVLVFNSYICLHGGKKRTCMSQCRSLSYRERCLKGDRIFIWKYVPNLFMYC